jgi:hypothetical protein
MAAPSEEKLICHKFNLEALTVNQMKSFKALADGKANRNPWLAKMANHMHAQQYVERILIINKNTDNYL